MVMNIRVKYNVKMNSEQFEELGKLLAEPDITWEGELERFNKENPHSRAKSELVEISGDYGTYTARINYAHEVITILKVES